MRLGRDDERECFERRRHVNLRVDEHSAAALYLTEIVGAAFGRDCPQNEGRVNAPEFIRARQVLDLQHDARVAAARAPDLRLALEPRQSRRAPELECDVLVERVSYSDGLALYVALRERRG